MAEWLGTGLQNRLQQFDSARYLTNDESRCRTAGFTFFYEALPPMQPLARNICRDAVRTLCAQARRVIGLALLIILLGGTASSTAMAEERQTLNLDLTEGCDTTVYLATFLPGKQIYELEGHSALRIVTPYSDTAITWGMFDFNAPHFVYRFVKGETDYSVAAVPWTPFLYSYVRQRRATVLQKLNLTREQIQRLMALVEENLRPENRVYRYNFIADNCATRPLQIIEKAIGQELDLGRTCIYSFDIGDGTTYRNVMRRYHANYPWYQFGIDLALGDDIDRPVGGSDNMRGLTFAPVLLTKILESSTFKATDLSKNDLAKFGITEPYHYDISIVSRTINIDEFGSQVQEGSPGIPPFLWNPELGRDTPEECRDILPPTPWYLTPMAAMLVLLAISFFVARAVAVKWRRMRGFYCLFFGANAIVGCIIAFLVFFSEHYATSSNWLILWLNPFAIIPAITIWTPKRDKLTNLYMELHEVAMIFMCIAWLFIYQTANDAFWPWIAADFILTFAWTWRDISMAGATKQQMAEYHERNQQRNSKHRRLWPWRKRETDYIYEIRDSHPQRNRH